MTIKEMDELAASYVANLKTTVLSKPPVKEIAKDVLRFVSERYNLVPKQPRQDYDDPFDRIQRINRHK